MKSKKNYPNFGHKYDGDFDGTLQTGDFGFGKCNEHWHDSFEVIYQMEAAASIISIEKKLRLCRAM